jgi:hypothetical protein
MSICHLLRLFYLVIRKWSSYRIFYVDLPLGRAYGLGAKWFTTTKTE